MNYKIAHIDESAQSISNFYHSFKSDFEIVKIQVKEGSTIDSIINLAFENEIDAIVVDYMLDEEGDVDFNGNLIFEQIRLFKPHFPIVMLTSHEPQAIDHMEDVHIIYSKDILDGESEEELQIFKSKIKSNITNYYKKIDDTNKKIEELVEKRNNGSLEILEEEQLSKLFILFDELNPKGKDLPSHFIQRESITQLNEFVAEAKEILGELKKINKK
jgi:hypothetical protein